jgi:syntaxin 5
MEDLNNEMSVARRRRGSSKSEDTPLTTEWVTDYGDEDKENNMGRDRTGEFHSALRSLQGRANTRQLQPGTNGFNNNKVNRNLEQYSDFMKIARTIGKNISKTYNKLEQLALLAKRKSLFDDKSVQIQELTFIIKEDINALNKDIARLQASARGNQSQNGKHMQSHSSGVVVGLQSKLASMSNEFKNVLKVRTENLKEQRSRQDQFSQGPVASSLPPSALTGYHRGSVLIQDEAHSGGEVSIDMGADTSLRLRQSQISAQDDTESYLTSRAETMQSIESTIVELGGIFQQLALMVKEQEEVVHRIDGNIEDAEMNVEAAHTELLKYFRSVTSNRWLMIKVFALLIFFFVIFVIFLA